MRAPSPILSPSRLLTWALFWTAVGLFYAVYFGRVSGNYRGSLYLVVLLLPIAIATSHLFADVLIPRYLLQRRLIRFGLFSVYLIIAGLYLQFLSIVAVFIFLADYDMTAMSPEALDYLGIGVGLHLVVALVVAIRLVQQWYALKDRHSQAEKARLESELSALKKQLHPHFLFNALNNVYALSLARSEATPDAVLRLSALLDYMLYPAREPRVELAQELEFIRSYLEVERLRVGDRMDLVFDEPVNSDGTPIAPLLLLPLIENAIKHGLQAGPGDARLEVRVSVTGDLIAVRVVNSLPEKAGEPVRGGIGIENLSRRLRLLYPNRHTLHLNRETDRFVAELTLEGPPDHDPLPVA